MTTKSQRGAEIFYQHLADIEAVLAAVARKARLNGDVCDELYSAVMLKLIENDYAVLRRFRGKSRWCTYLTVVVQRVLLDQRDRQWGRWRPCAAARRLGPVAEELDRRMHRDGLSMSEAVGLVRGQRKDCTEAELENLAVQVRRRPRRRLINGEGELGRLVSKETAVRGVEIANQHRSARKLRLILGTALQSLKLPERRLLKLRFGRGWTVRKIADRQGLPARRLYGKFEGILRRLQAQLVEHGVQWEDIESALESREVDLGADLI